MATTQESNYGDRYYFEKDVTVFESAARTIATNSALYQPNSGDRFNARGMHLIINVSAIVTAPSIIVSIDIFEGKQSLIFYPVLTGPSISTTGYTILKIFPGIDAVPNLSANDFLPDFWRVSVAVANANSMTYSIVAKLFY